LIVKGASAGAALEAGSFADFDPTLRVVLFLVNGAVAASAHGTKAVAYVAINASPDRFNNIGESVSILIRLAIEP
jgi:hypothetical protein